MTLIFPYVDSFFCLRFTMIPDSRDLCLTSHLKIIFSSVQFSRSVVSNSLRPHESQHARPPCPSPTPRVHPDSRPSSQWCHLILCHPLLLLLSIPPSIRVFSNESTLRMRWPKYWSFSYYFKLIRSSLSFWKYN